jgi:hypothetical protein
MEIELAQYKAKNQFFSIKAEIIKILKKIKRIIVRFLVIIDMRLLGHRIASVPFLLSF